MKLPDVNLLLYAYDSGSPLHGPARDWLEQTLSGAETVALCWAVMVSFVRIATNPAIFGQPRSADDALGLIDSWVAQPCVTIVHATSRHAALLRELLLPLGTAGPLASDAHLAALAIEHGAELCSHDGDFARFPGLRWVDPLRV